MVLLSYLLVLAAGVFIGSLRVRGKAIRAIREHQARIIEIDRRRQLAEIEAERRRAEEAMRRAAIERRWQSW